MKSTPLVAHYSRRQAAGTGSLAVVHVALHGFGVEPFRAFVESYRKCDAGVSHDLVVVFKGFPSETAANRHRELLGGLDYAAMFVDDEGYDLGAYFRAVSTFARDAYCLLNSRSVLLVPGWLEALHRHASLASVGMAGATATMESLYTDYVNLHRHAPNADGAVRGWLRRSFVNVIRHRYQFPPFPNPHLRTNAVVVRREVLQRIRRWPFRTKRDAARFENGRRSISRQILAQGLDLLVVGRDGVGYPRSDWARSRTFWQGNQENLLVADNQTERYARADASERAELSRLAWGAVLSGNDQVDARPSP